MFTRAADFQAGVVVISASQSGEGSSRHRFASSTIADRRSATHASDPKRSQLPVNSVHETEICISTSGDPSPFGVRSVNSLGCIDFGIRLRRLQNGSWARLLRWGRSQLNSDHRRRFAIAESDLEARHPATFEQSNYNRDG